MHYDIGKSELTETCSRTVCNNPIARKHLFSDRWYCHDCAVAINREMHRCGDALCFEMGIRPKIALYLDMDGCFTDFSARAHEVFEHFHIMEGLYSDELHCDEKKQMRKEMVKAIAETKDFWHNLPWVEGGDELYKFVTANFDLDNVSMLTAPMSNDPNCHDGKHHWVIHNMDRIKNIIIDDNKANYVNHLHGEVQILIDDRPKNIKAWAEAGGIGILHHHTKVEETLEQLRQFV